MQLKWTRYIFNVRINNLLNSSSISTKHGQLLLAGLLFFVLTVNLSAQSTGRFNQGGAAQYFLGDQDQILMPVNVWGFVNKPGQYMVPYDTDLITLLSYAGGPQEEAKMKTIKLVRLLNNTGAEHTNGQVIEIDVKKFLKSADQDENPSLKPGDTVVVSGSTFHFVNKFFDFAWRVATIAQVYALIDYYTGRD